METTTQAPSNTGDTTVQVKYQQMYNELFVKDDWKIRVDHVCSIIMHSKDRYRVIEISTGVPWYVVAAIHSLEAGCDFGGVLHNGEIIIGSGRRTGLVPAGRGPFNTWEESAVDALEMKRQIWPSNWELDGAMLDFLERYNGLGYRRKGVPSPYLWSGSQHYTSGKYVADGKYSSTAVSKQIGAALIIKKLRSM